MGGVTFQSNNAVKKINDARIPSLQNLSTPFSSREHQTNSDELSFQFYLKSSSSLEELLLKELKQFINFFINCAYKTRSRSVKLTSRACNLSQFFGTAR